MPTHPTPTPTPPPLSRYPKTRRILHWIGGPLLLGAFAAGATADNSDASGAVYLWALRAHILLGLSGATLSALRIRACLRMPVSPLPHLPSWRQTVMKFDHRFLYLSSVLLGLSGLTLFLAGGVREFVTGAGPVPALAGTLPRSFHGILATVFLALFAAHMVGLISHQVAYGNTLARMGLKK